MWVKKGRQPYVWTGSQHGKRLNVFGCVDPLDGRHGTIRQEKGTAEGFLAMLKEILRRYKVLIDLWADHARWHKGERVSECLLQHRRLTIKSIPMYHPELNFQEALWTTMRYEKTTN